MMLTLNPNLPHPNLTVHPPPWDIILEDPAANETDDFDITVDAFSSDNFRMYEFKIRKCARVRSHDWTECPFAHPGEKARRRDPRKVRYTGATCPEFRKGTCAKGDACEYAHGVFETWLHPSRYRTQPCKDGIQCRRRVCFFAHTPDQIRVLPESLARFGLDSLSTQSESPPMSPVGELASQMGRMGMGMNLSSPGWGVGFWPSQMGHDSASTQSGSPPMSPVSELAASMCKMRMSMSPPGWGIGHVSAQSGFFSLPSTPTKAVTRPGIGFDNWDGSIDEEPVMERVESGRGLRARMYAKLSKENSLDRADPVVNCPDMSWIAELVN